MYYNVRGHSTLMGHEITSSCVCSETSCMCAQFVCLCMWEGWLLRGLLTQSIKAVWDSHWDTKGLRMWAPHKQDGKTVPPQNTNMGTYFLPQQLPTHRPSPATANTSTLVLLLQLAERVLWFDQLCSPTEEIINNSLNSLPPNFHCDSVCRTSYVYDNDLQGSVWSLVYRTLPYLTVNGELQGSVKGAADLKTYFSLCSPKHIQQPQAKEYSQHQNGGEPGLAITKPWLLLCPRARQYMAIQTCKLLRVKKVSVTETVSLFWLQLR